MEIINNYFKNGQYNTSYLLSKALEDDDNYTNLVKTDEYIKLVSEITNKIDTSILEKKIYIRVFLMGNWIEPKKLCDLWNHMSKGDYTWNNIKIVWEEPCDYYCIINKPPNDNIYYDPKRTIIFRMEPLMDENIHLWGEKWSKPNKNEFKFVGYHEDHYNNNEWHLSKKYNELLSEEIIKDDNLTKTLTTTLSDKYSDKGHIKRIDFVKFLEEKNVDVHVYGGNRFLWKDYKGSLPVNCKDNSLFPYKYSFNVENNYVRNYYTEKLIDGILSETLVFYSGCPNIKELIDERAYVYLELSNFENDYEIVKKALEEDWWSQRIEYIRKEKKRILNELQFFPRLEKIINE